MVSAEVRRDVRVERCSADQADVVPTVLARAFTTDSVYETIVPDPARRARVLHQLFRLGTRDALRHGAVDVAVADSRVVGAAVWLAPDRFPLGAGRKVRLLPGLIALGLLARNRLPALLRLGSRVEALHEPGPRWYLQAMGVDPDAQGDGIGRRLLAHGLQRADREHLPAALETASTRAARLYGRAGFVTSGPRLQLVPGAPPHQVMRRPAPPERPGQTEGS